MSGPLDEALSRYLSADPKYNRPDVRAAFVSGWLAAIHWREGRIPESDDLGADRG